jgi:hypothetical protein
MIGACQTLRDWMRTAVIPLGLCITHSLGALSWENHSFHPPSYAMRQLPEDIPDLSSVLTQLALADVFSANVMSKWSYIRSLVPH